MNINKLYLILLLSIFLVLPLLSAEQIIYTSRTLNPFGTEKIIIASPDSYLSYPAIRLSKTFFWIETDKIAEYKLTNVECGITICNMDYQVTTYLDTTLFDNKLSVTRDGEDIELEYAEYFVKNGTEEYEVNDLETTCNKNDSGFESCASRTIGKHKEIRDRWDKYDFSDVGIGTYKVRLKGKIKAGDSIDVKPYSQNREFTEHAVWTSSLNVNLEAYYKLDETSGTNVINSVGNAATKQGTPTQGVTGILGTAYNGWSNTNYIDINSVITLNNSWTLNAWVYPTTISTNHYYLGPASSGGGKWGGAITTGAVNNICFEKDGVGETCGGKVEVNTWSMVTLVYDGTNILTYKNGTLFTNTSVSNGASVNHFIGMDFGPDRFFIGTIDELGYWSRNLGTTEIVQLYNSGTGITYTNVFESLTATQSYPVNIYNETATRTIGVGCNFTSTNQNISSVKLNVYDSLDNLDYSNIENLVGENISYNKTWTTSTLSNDNYTWACYGYGNQGINGSTANRTFQVTIPINLQALQSAPIENFNTTNPNMTIGCNFTSSNQNISSVKLSVYDSSNNLDFNDAVSIVGYNVSFNKTWQVNLSSPNQDTYKWACYGYGDQGVNASTNNRTFEIHFNPPTITIYSPSGNQGLKTLPYNITLNYTANDAKLQSCWFNSSFNATITYTPCNITNITSVPNGNTNRIYVYANDTFGNTNVSVSSFYPAIILNSVSYNAAATSASSEKFIFNATIIDSYSGIFGYLTYNNTNYSSSMNGQLFTSSITIPVVSTSQNKSFYLLFGLTNSSGTSYYSTQYYNQTVNPFTIDNCTTNSNFILKLSMVDEQTPPSFQSINGTINMLVTFYSANRNILLSAYNTTFNYVDAPVSVCINNISGSYSMDYSIQHFGNTSNYFTKFRNIQNVTVTNKTGSSNITLYNLLYNSGNTFQISVTGAPLADNSNILVDVQKEYLGLNSYPTVESPVTDSLGKAVAHLIPSTEVYNFVLSRNGFVLGSFNRYQVKCTNAATGDCTVQLNIGQTTLNIPDYTNYGDISAAYSLDQNDSVLYLTFQSTDGTSKDINLQVIAADNYDNNTLCSASTSGISGTLVCNIPKTYLNKSFYAQSYSDGTYLGSVMFSLGPSPNWQGADIILELLLYSSLVLIFLSSPVLMVIGAIIGFVLAVLIIFVTGGTFGAILAILVWFIAAGATIIYKMRKPYGGV